MYVTAQVRLPVTRNMSMVADSRRYERSGVLFTPRRTRASARAAAGSRGTAERQRLPRPKGARSLDDRRDARDDGPAVRARGSDRPHARGGREPSRGSPSSTPPWPAAPRTPTTACWGDTSGAAAGDRGNIRRAAVRAKPDGLLPGPRRLHPAGRGSSRPGPGGRWPSLARLAPGPRAGMGTDALPGCPAWLAGRPLGDTSGSPAPCCAGLGSLPRPQLTISGSFAGLVPFTCVVVRFTMMSSAGRRRPWPCRVRTPTNWPSSATSRSWTARWGSSPRSPRGSATSRS